MADTEQDAQRYEDEHVHTVYDQIASHFSSTRYKPWPIIERFLLDLSPGSIGLDVGCGNGKYLAVNRNVFIVGSDRSSNLVEFAKAHQPSDTVVADMLSIPHPNGQFDFAICIAAVHHLATSARRIAAIAGLLDSLISATAVAGSVVDMAQSSKDSLEHRQGRALIYVWALEQKDSRRGWDTRDKQDVMVPWVMKNSQKQNPKSGAKPKPHHQVAVTVDQEHSTVESDPQLTEGIETPAEQTFHRYYHLYRSGELEQDIRAAGGKVLDSGYEKDNWWAIAAKASS